MQHLFCDNEDAGGKERQGGGENVVRQATERGPRSGILGAVKGGGERPEETLRRKAGTDG